MRGGCGLVPWLAMDEILTGVVEKKDRKKKVSYKVSGWGVKVEAKDNFIEP